MNRPLEVQFCDNVIVSRESVNFSVISIGFYYKATLLSSRMVRSTGDDLTSELVCKANNLDKHAKELKEALDTLVDPPCEFSALALTLQEIGEVAIPEIVELASRGKLNGGTGDKKVLKEINYMQLILEAFSEALHVERNKLKLKPRSIRGKRVIEIFWQRFWWYFCKAKYIRRVCKELERSHGRIGVLLVAASKGDPSSMVREKQIHIDDFFGGERSLPQFLCLDRRIFVFVLGAMFKGGPGEDIVVGERFNVFLRGGLQLITPDKWEDTITLGEHLQLSVIVDHRRSQRGTDPGVIRCPRCNYSRNIRPDDTLEWVDCRQCQSSFSIATSDEGSEGVHNVNSPGTSNLPENSYDSLAFKVYSVRIRRGIPSIASARRTEVLPGDSGDDTIGRNKRPSISYQEPKSDSAGEPIVRNHPVETGHRQPMNVHKPPAGMDEPESIKKLRAVLNPVDASHEYFATDYRSRCFEGTRVALLSEIEGWVTGQGNHTPIYVLDGIAGIGKSTVAQTLAERAVAAGWLGASFFFSWDDQERNTTSYFFPTIAFQLAQYSDGFAQAIMDTAVQNPDVATSSLLHQFQVLILEPLQGLLSHQKSPILIVVDALNECGEDEGANLLTLLAQYLPTIPQLNFFITFRPAWHIRDVLDRASHHELFHLHDIGDSTVQSDIRLYLDICLSTMEVQQRFPHLQPPWQLSAEKMEILCGICGTSFIIASTITKFILDTKRSDPEKQLLRLLEGVSPTDFRGASPTNVMDKFYIQILLSAVPDDLEDHDSWVNRYQLVVGAILVLQTSLPCSTLAALLGVKSSFIEEALLYLHSLVAPRGPEMILQVHHESFPDFITNPDRIERAAQSLPQSPVPVSRFLIDTQYHHLQVAKACLRIMRHNLRTNLANDPPQDWHEDLTQIEHHHKQASAIPPELVYAGLNWVFHLEASQNLDDDARTELGEWSCHSIPAWLEMMSRLGQIDDVGWAMDKAREVIVAYEGDWPERTQIWDLFSDTSLMIQQSGESFK